ncbi:MAG TPA: ParA family protein [Coleofasciculaceae cyanobacterium]|jgi:cellulose biosynthesis protein BcsQ
MVATTFNKISYDNIIKIWKKLPNDYSEKNLELNFVQPLLLSLNLEISQILDINLGAGAGLKPDRLIYPDFTKSPALVIEIKKRVSSLATVCNQDFIDECQKHQLYRDAIGYKNSPKENGIKQYLNKSNTNIDPNRLASYGLVFNGDFFQLWRRVDGLILPLTPIQRMTESTIPELMQQLEYCLYGKPKALVTAVWNRKGGVAKTTNTLNLASVLALEGKKVLLLDLDTQNDLTRALNLEPNNYSDYLESCFKKIHAGYLDDAKQILKDTIQTRNYSTTDKKNFSLSILPGNQKSQNKLRDNSTDYDRNLAIKLKQKLIELCAENYDYIFIDVSPANDYLTIATILSCDTFIILLDYSKKTLHHAVDLYQKDAVTIRQNRVKQNHLHIGPWNLGIVFSNCPPGVASDSQLEKYIQQELKNKRFTGYQCKTRLAIYAQTKLAEYKHLPVICWQNSPITKLYKQLADEIFLGHHFIDN